MDSKIKILYEDKNLIAVNKPAGLLVHKTRVKSEVEKENPPSLRLWRTTEKTLADFLIKKYPEIKSVGDDPKERPGIVHRLDKDTSGVILIARNQKYFEYLKNLFQNHQIKKIYAALVWGKVEPGKGVIEKPIGIKHNSIKRTVHGGRMVKEAITEYKVVKYLYDSESGEYFSLVEVSPKTGRTHQIRVHFASIHHSVIGDPLYGRKENPFGLKKQFLHAQYVEFNIDEKRKIRIEAPLPEDLKDIINKLKSP